MEKITLSKPFKLQNGKEISELQLAFGELSTSDFRQIKKLEAQISDATAFEAKDIAQMKSMSFEFQLASAFLAALKGTDGLKIDDFTKIPMRDALNLAQVANFFWLGVA